MIKYVAIYKTNIITKLDKFIINDNVKIEVVDEFKGKIIPFKTSTDYQLIESLNNRSFQKSLIDEMKNIQDTVYYSGKNQKLIIITLRTREKKGGFSLENYLKKIKLLMTLKYGYGFFEKELFKGIIYNVNDGFERYASVIGLKPVSLNNKDLENIININIKPENVDLNKLNLIYHFFEKYLDENDSKIKFLLLFMILEIYPMEDSTNIKKLKEYLKNCLNKYNKDPQNIVNKVGRIHGIRSDIVHKGTYPEKMTAKEFNDYLRLLDDITLFVIGEYLCLEYNGKLDKYL